MGHTAAPVGGTQGTSTGGALVWGPQEGRGGGGGEGGGQEGGRGGEEGYTCIRGTFHMFSQFYLLFNQVVLIEIQQLF